MADPRVAEFGACYTGIVHDVMREMGLSDFTLPPRIAPLQPELTLCGPAFTIEGRADEAADPHETLLAWTGLLSECPAGRVWTAQPHARDVAQMGELSAETLHAKGVLGCVLDGALRDAGFIIRLGFPSWRTHHTPRDIVGRWLPVATEVDILIDDVRISPGDWLHGDRDGIVRVPAERLDEVIGRSVEAMRTESKVRKAIVGGMDPRDAYLKWGKF